MVKVTLFQKILLIALLLFILVMPGYNISVLTSNISALMNTARDLENTKDETNKVKSEATKLKTEYDQKRTSELDVNDPIAITKVLRGLTGVTVVDVKALSLTQNTESSNNGGSAEIIPSILGPYDENSNQWCEGLEFTLKTDSTEKLLLQLEKMQLSILSISIKSKNIITVQVNVKGV